MARLSDDGTLDTVIVCEKCGAEARYNYDADSWEMTEDTETNGRVKPEDGYAEFVEWAIEDFDSEHECELQEEEQEDDDENL